MHMAENIYRDGDEQSGLSRVTSPLVDLMNGSQSQSGLLLPPSECLLSSHLQAEARWWGAEAAPPNHCDLSACNSNQKTNQAMKNGS